MNKITRKRELPSGWYPGTHDEIETALKQWKNEILTGKKAHACIVPHAGWAFSGKTAFITFSSIEKDVNTIVVAGGHLGSDDPPLAAKEDKFNTTTGFIENNTEMLAYLAEKTTFYKDSYPDNTVEINLPIIKYLYPECRILWLRIPPSYNTVVEIAKNIYEYGQKSGIKIAVAGSTDLTHYGFNYGFHPHGTGRSGLEWVKSNDREFINYISDFQISRAIDHSLENHSACSSGAAALAAEYALVSKCKKGELISYHTSYDISPSDSFVGYAGIIYC